MRIMQPDYQFLADAYWLAFLLTGHGEMSVDIALRTLEHSIGRSRRDAIANALAGVRDELAVSAIQTELQECDGSKVAPPNWSLDLKTTKMQIQTALLAIDVFPRCALLLRVFEGMQQEEVSDLLNCDRELTAKGCVTGLLALTRNLAVMQGLRLPTAKSLKLENEMHCVWE